MGKMTWKGLMEQDLGELDVIKLHPVSPEVSSRQPTITIGTIGHVAHEKSTVVKAISGVQTNRFKCELERNITVKLGYANAKMKVAPVLSATGHMEVVRKILLYDVPMFEDCRMKLVRHVSFVYCLGDKNIIKFECDHNSPHPDQFYFDSINIFLHNVLQPPEDEVLGTTLTLHLITLTRDSMMLDMKMISCLHPQHQVALKMLLINFDLNDL